MPPAGSSISIPTKLLATGVACALAIVVCGTAATVMVASDVTNKVGGADRKGPFTNASPDLGARDSFRDAGATAGAIDSLLRPLGDPAAVDTTGVAVIAAFNADQAQNPIWETAPEARPLPGPVPKSIFARRQIANGLDSLTPAELAEVSGALKEPWLPTFRAWARTTRQPALWGYRRGLPGGTDARGLPSRSFGPWRSLFAANEYASLLALRDGHSQEAMQHALENIAAARHFIEQPVMIDALVGRLYLQRGLQLVALVANSTRDTITAQRALRLDSAAHHFVSASSVRVLAQRSADPSSVLAEQFIANRDIHPALRIDAMRTITAGGCRSLPEVVFGFSEARREALGRASNSISDIDRGNELAEREQRLLAQMMNIDSVPDSLPASSILERSAILNAFAWIVPPGVRARAALCLRQGYRSQSAEVRENAVVGVH